jgi:hypothetical protein
MDEPPVFRLENVWASGEPAHHAAAMEFWRRHELLPAGVDPRERARQMAVLAWAGEEIAGVASAVIHRMPQVRVRLAMFRCSVAPAYRREGLAAGISIATRDALEAWSRDNPSEAVMGMGCIVQGRDLLLKRTQPYWPLTGLALAGYNARGEQFRIVWFNHARVE